MTAIPRERLEKTLSRVAREQGLDQERLRRWVSFLALCGVLERATQEGVIPGYYLKGGAAMELRFAMAARATRDLDIGLAGDRAGRLAAFEAALQLGFDEFTFRVRSQARHMELADTVRAEVAIAYRTRAWQSIEVDLGPPGAEDVDLVHPAIGGLEEMGLTVTNPVRCLGLSEQVAQKLHACTGLAAAGRARDILDILLIDTLDSLDYEKTRTAVERIFAERNTHPVPTGFVIPATWEPELEVMAHSLGAPVQDIATIRERFQDVLAAIAPVQREKRSK